MSAVTLTKEDAGEREGRGAWGAWERGKGIDT
jgi:hypothetical protein